jgi:hypothetical protein
MTQGSFAERGSTFMCRYQFAHALAAHAMLPGAPLPHNKHHGWREGEEKLQPARAQGYDV